MIKYVQNKPINYPEVESLLKESADLCRFSNGGPVKAKLESLLTKQLDITSKKLICVNNGTAALHVLMFLYESLSDKDEFKWATVGYNFPCPVVNKFNATVFDIELDVENSYSIALSEELKSHDGFVLPTLFGTLPSNFKQVIIFCHANDIVLLLDNASSPLTKFEGINICELGDASIGSLHHTKYLGFGEGGFLVVNKDLAAQADSLANFGFFQNRIHKPLSSNFKMSDVSAAFIYQHVAEYRLDFHLNMQKQFSDKLNVFNELGSSNSGNCELVYGNLPIQFKDPTSQLIFRDYGIEANKYYVPLADLPNCNFLYERMVNFPLHSTLSEYEVNKIIEQVEFQQSK